MNPTPPASAAKPPDPPHGYDNWLDAVVDFTSSFTTTTIHGKRELVALRARVADLEKELKRAADMLGAVAGDIEDGYSLESLRGKYLGAIVDARDAARAALAREERTT